MKSHLSKLKGLMHKKKLDALLISSVPNITYLTGFSNFSKDEREACLLILAQPRRSMTRHGYILTDGRYSEAVTDKVKNFELIEISINQSLKEILKNLAKKEKIKKLGIEEDNLTVSEYKSILKYFDDTYHYSASDIRSIKEPEELEKIRKSSRIGDEAFTYILNKVREGITEKELALELEHFIKKLGADLSFPPIVAFGKNSSIPHHQTGNAKLKAGNFVLLDFGVKLENYCSDMTRTVILGKANDEQKKIYQTVLEAQKKAINLLNTKYLILNTKSRSVNASDVDNATRTYIESQGYPTIPHSLGHGIGLEVHESPSLSPRSKDVLKASMVFSIEPGIYLKGIGGVRVEDLIVLEKTSSRLLTKSPRNLIEL